MLFGDCDWGKTAFGDKVLYRFFWHKLANIVPFGLKIGLPINVDLNDGKAKSKSICVKLWPKCATFDPK